MCIINMKSSPFAESFSRYFFFNCYIFMIPVLFSNVSPSSALLNMLLLNRGMFLKTYIDITRKFAQRFSNIGRSCKFLKIYLNNFSGSFCGIQTHSKRFSCTHIFKIQKKDTHKKKKTYSIFWIVSFSILHNMNNLVLSMNHLLRQTCN